MCVSFMFVWSRGFLTVSVWVGCLHIDSHVKQIDRTWMKCSIYCNILACVPVLPFIHDEKDELLVICLFLQWYWVRWSRPSQYQKMLHGWRRPERVPATTWERCCSLCSLWPPRFNRRWLKPMDSTMREKVKKKSSGSHSFTRYCFNHSLRTILFCSVSVKLM